MSKVTTAEGALQEANALVVEDNFQEALKSYDLSIELDSTNPEAFIKRSICHFKLLNYTKALEDANVALKLDPNNAKAYLRKGMALFSLDEYEAAKSAFERGEQLDASNTQFKTWIRKCGAELDSENGGIGSATTFNDANKNQKNENANTPAPTPSAPPTQTPTQTPTVPKIRHEWYQTPTDVIVTIFAKGVTKDTAQIELTEKTLSATIKLSSSNDYQLDLDLCDKIKPSESSTEFLSTKIEIKMKKANAARWKTLEDSGEGGATAWGSVVTPTAPAAKKKNWDAIAKETEDEKLDGDAGLNKVFQDIFSNGTDEQKRAMMKSYVESGGTVLSTNWDEVGKATVKGSPPDGMEMHHWTEQ